MENSNATSEKRKNDFWWEIHRNETVVERNNGHSRNDINIGRFYYYYMLSFL
jgi:hypothetical protein